jgi:hypothetical protein
MFLKLSTKSQITILAIKMREINFSKETEKAKKEMIEFYRKKLKKIQPDIKF